MENSRKVDSPNQVDSRADAVEQLEKLVQNPEMTSLMADMMRAAMQDIPASQKISSILSIASDLDLTVSELMTGLFAYIEVAFDDRSIGRESVNKFLENVEILCKELHKKINK